MPLKEFVKVALWFVTGYYVVTKIAPTVQAKFETMNLDEMWDVYSEEWR